MPITFGENFKRLRNKAELTQLQVAHAAGESVTQISDLENDRHNPGGPRLQRLCKALGVSPAEIMQDSEGVGVVFPMRKRL